jgi:hypothetical protein
MRGGRDTIDHPPGTNDDCANVIAGLAVHRRRKSRETDRSGLGTAR